MYDCVLRRTHTVRPYCVNVKFHLSAKLSFSAPNLPQRCLQREGLVAATKELTDEEKMKCYRISSPTILQGKMVPPPRWGGFVISAKSSFSDIPIVGASIARPHLIYHTLI